MATSSKSSETGVKKTRQSHNKKVPPDAPRRNLSSFVIFANARRIELKELYPERPYPAIQSDISREWEQMDEKARAPWKKEMEIDQERYRHEMELYRKYRSGWVWVVGDQRRKELGLTIEDCTKIEFPSSTEGQGGSLRPPQSRINPERSVKRKKHTDEQAAGIRQDNREPGLVETPVPAVAPAQPATSSSHSTNDCYSDMQFYEIPDPSFPEGDDILDNGLLDGDDMSFYSGLGLVRIAPPPAFVGYGVDPAWSDPYAWCEQ
ncbi:hypothetical protein TWF481_003434 [Arthrobotrys musiformis]|uniref:HMG box domain-containing protein n=1 Tax=Arthrobotrys musiformis TaxID=47236 RepID=A0AAV9VSS2_9PEZI